MSDGFLPEQTMCADFAVLPGAGSPKGACPPQHAPRQLAVIACLHSELHQMAICGIDGGACGYSATLLHPRTVQHVAGVHVDELRHVNARFALGPKPQAWFERRIGKIGSRLVGPDPWGGNHHRPLR
ncbi:hypothetical protein ACGFZL_11365 [Streptomyces sp. NPDC048182]|uniref:hypothetical protein n=1 Tax=Streptomyces sp. NPDC048182 TaxID=3365507 RepID=UPI00371B8211